MESDEAPDPEILAAITEALQALKQTQSALILEIVAAIQAPGRGRKKIASVEAAARKAAETLFTLAELLVLARD
jgi:hypothetical protein